MESSIAAFLTRWSACELLPTIMYCISARTVLLHFRQGAVCGRSCCTLVGATAHSVRTIWLHFRTACELRQNTAYNKLLFCSCCRATSNRRLYLHRITSTVIS